MAAYVDGELDSKSQAELQAWLQENPHEAADVEAQRQLARLWQYAAPPEPSPQAWEEIGGCVQAAYAETLLGPSPPLNRIRKWLRPWGWSMGLITTAAASLVLALTLLRPGLQTKSGSNQPAAVLLVEDRGIHDPDNDIETPFPVAQSEEIEIISMDSADLELLVMGDFPLREAIVLVSVGDISLHRVEPDAKDEMVPFVNMSNSGNTPMIVAPLKSQ